MKLSLFLDIIGRDETFSESEFQVSGVRCQTSSRVFTPDTLVTMSNFHAIPQQLGCHSHLSKLNDDICIYNHLTNQLIN